MQTSRTIKKYPNRRLYDTSISSYVTLQDIKQLIVDHIPFHVIDARSQQDLTRTTLLQLLQEEEERSATPMFSAELLGYAIRARASAKEQSVAEALQHQLKQLAQRHEATRVTMPAPAHVEAAMV